MGVYRHHERVCTESWPWEKSPLPHWGINPAAVMCLSDALPTELHPHPYICQSQAPPCQLLVIVLATPACVAVFMRLSVFTSASLRAPPCQLLCTVLTLPARITVFTKLSLHLPVSGSSLSAPCSQCWHPSLYHPLLWTVIWSWLMLLCSVSCHLIVTCIKALIHYET